MTLLEKPAMEDELKDVIIKLLLSLLIGLILGGEREYRNKSAGLRTIILICVGATMFTILSHKLGDGSGTSRVAANVVTGIGFLGAGAIMREGLTISGLTTASTIWVAAALGMAVGIGEYSLAFAAMALCFLVLTTFGYVQDFIYRRVSRTLDLHITMEGLEPPIHLLEQKMTEMNLKILLRKQTRSHTRTNYQYEVVGREKELKSMLDYLNRSALIVNYTY